MIKTTGLLVAMALLACTTTGMGQLQAQRYDEYWVVESHGGDSIYSVVRFYDGSDRLLHEVTIENVAINVQQRRSRKKLDHLLAEYRARKMSGKKLKSRQIV